MAVLSVDVVKRFFRYLKCTQDYGLWYKRSGTQDLRMYSELDYACDATNRKFTSGMIALLNS